MINMLRSLTINTLDKTYMFPHNSTITILSHHLVKVFITWNQFSNNYEHFCTH